METEPMLPEPGDHKWIAVGLVILAVVLIYLGLAQPGADSPPKPTEAGAKIQQDRADRDGGFGTEASPDEPPRGPGPD
jgi:hypothetical protein